MLSREDKIRLIHDCRTYLLNRMFDELSRKAPGSTEQVCDEIVSTAKLSQNALAKADEIHCPSRSLFVLAVQQVIDSFIVGLLTDEALQSLARERDRADQDLLDGIDFGREQ